MTIDLDGSIALDDDDDESAETDDATNARAFCFCRSRRPPVDPRSMPPGGYGRSGGPARGDAEGRGRREPRLGLKPEGEEKGHERDAQRDGGRAASGRALADLGDGGVDDGVKGATVEEGPREEARRS